MLMVALVAVLHPQTAPTGFGLGALRCVGLDWVGWAGLGWVVPVSLKRGVRQRVKGPGGGGAAYIDCLCMWLVSNCAALLDHT